MSFEFSQVIKAQLRIPRIEVFLLHELNTQYPYNPGD